MTYNYYILLYTVIYDFCTTPARPTGTLGASRGGAQLQGADLYRSLHQYLSEHCKALREVSSRPSVPVGEASELTRQECANLSDIELLRFYAKKWETYTRGATYVNKLFAYLNKHWVKREKDEGRKEVYTVYTVSLNRFTPRNHNRERVAERTRLTLGSQLGLVAWKHNFFSYFSQSKDISQLTQALLRQIEAQRNGEEVDQTLMKGIIQSYGELPSSRDMGLHGAKLIFVSIARYRRVGRATTSALRLRRSLPGALPRCHRGILPR